MDENAKYTEDRKISLEQKLHYDRHLTTKSGSFGPTYTLNIKYRLRCHRGTTEKGIYKPDDYSINQS